MGSDWFFTDLPGGVGGHGVNRIIRGTEWVWETRVETTQRIRKVKWAEAFEYLQRFAEREGHARPLSSHKEGGYNLGRWVVTQRTQRDSKSRNNLTPHRITRLEALPGWVWDASEFRWEEGFSALQRFTAREGHARPPSSHKEREHNLGMWVRTLRARPNNVTPEQVARLEALPGWVWDPNEFAWEEGFSALQRFTAREGHVSASTVCPPSHMTMGL